MPPRSRRSLLVIGLMLAVLGSATKPSKALAEETILPQAVPVLMSSKQAVPHFIQALQDGGILALFAHFFQAEVPPTVEALWSDFDPRKEPLQTEVVRQWEADGITYRYVTFHIGTFLGKDARMAAFYGYPSNGKQLPGLLHLHGGGQRAFCKEVEFYAKRGYACLSINWGGREMEDAQPGDPNTDWGAVDPTQQNVPGYLNLLPGQGYLDPVESPRNNNWYLLTLGARRGLTFLEQQAEVDAKRLGVYGHSMGGNLTVYVAGTEDRVRVAAPSVGGQGFRTIPWKLLPEQRPRTPRGDVNLFRSTLGFQSYAPRIKAPLLWLGATNDFHGIMDDTYRTGELIPHGQVRYSFTPHMNHRFTPEFAVTRPLWIDQHLKGNFRFPETPESKLVLSTSDGVPRFAVKPDTSRPIDRVDLFYSLDPDPQARFWRSVEEQQVDGTWTAHLPLLSVEQPLFAFANVHYQLKQQDESESASTFALSSQLHTITPQQLRQAKVQATDQPSLLIDDFSHGWRDWYSLAANHRDYWQYWTRKITDPKWRGQENYRLTFELTSERANQLVVVITENFFRSYRGRNQDYVALVSLQPGKQSISLAPSDFQSVRDQTKLRSWDQADLLGLCAQYRGKANEHFGSKSWAGKQPVLGNLRWEE